MKFNSSLCKRLALTLALCLGFSQTAWAEETIPDLLEPVSIKLDTFTAYVDDISELSLYDGSVVPYVEELSFPQEGTVSAMHVVIGQEVKAGDLLMTLNQEAERKQIKTLEADILRLETQSYYDMQLTEIDLSILAVELRALESQPYPDEKAIALKKLEIEELTLNKEMEAAIRTLELEKLQRKLTSLQEKVVQTELYAPFDGRVIHMANLSRGSYISAYTPLIFLADDTRLTLRSAFISGYNLSGAYDMYALIGAKKYAITPVDVDPTQYVAMLFSGETPMTDFIIQDLDENVTSGKYAAVCLQSKYVPDALLIPNNALYQGDSMRYVYVIENGIRVRRDVVTGVSNGAMTQVTEGLKEGEIVYVKE